MIDLRTSHTSRLFRTGPAINAGIILILTLLLLCSPASATVFLKNGTDITENDQVIHLIRQAADPGSQQIDFFYNTHCGACHLAMAYLTEYVNAHPETRINFIDIFNSSENKAQFEEYKAAYNRKYVAVPVVFIGNAGLEGESSIREYFGQIVSVYRQNLTSNPLSNGTSVSGQIKRSHRTVISIPLVLLAGIVDGINPCACAVIILFLAVLMGVRERRRIFSIGITFAGGVFFFYLLAGIGIFPFSKHSLIVTLISTIFAVLAVMSGIVLIKRTLFPAHCWMREKVEKTHRLYDIYAEYTFPLLFILGLLSGVLEIPCTGSIYVSILDLISFRVNIEQGLIYLLLYNLAFIIPVLIITGLAYYALPKDLKEEEKSCNRAGLNLFAGLLLIVFAFLVGTGVM